ncbi:MAG: hypothetical protein A3C85_03025 [Candidatus Doudnabacteria bacterium RIFCSPHIGHO2_02_FULL_48_21]|uniref:Metal-sensitive transcriptional regulator n=1 Tax=Candidatus Doudnabacteria bacterium RIFCSPLOWO2_02_FULL_48_13 TaxID=1817845 RepID=A0A1F5QC43_9BACT|nr:MAG: hypothetical protein A3K05_00285 [Candidatus Doudnabacteria bacterium RIFCSPHIGHO2_01_48_18]OGE77080.1 MAG: hypothetical protein A2668_02395 [Candidatus Doudnabacteria bacterium RIFCSPHIGHO2_01_FULL_48_180]OGE91621.1 MAG: hypothetical protein A3F44_02855 [Candidatus Doudnabacteria bacterium RIFCSPHIGHO2_12_FULL_47_25]OGE93235.1 MAG: hypothetical protein A3C85_03025 [Candidatus Doudnabacteria bacterium RIFCSPHIGHO2_02_FULL_48_21]OGE96358.1 MAG: hypothetical protein A3A83_01270 [Candidatu
MYQHLNQKLKNRALHRAKIIKGQMESLIRAVEKEEYCPMLLHRSFSIQRSLKSLDALMLENHLRTHVKQQLSGKEEERAIRELIEVFILSSK